MTTSILQGAYTQTVQETIYFEECPVGRVHFGPFTQPMDLFGKFQVGHCCHLSQSFFGRSEAMIKRFFEQCDALRSGCSIFSDFNGGFENFFAPFVDALAFSGGGFGDLGVEFGR
jgi:hypothetical protein